MLLQATAGYKGTRAPHTVAMRMLRPPVLVTGIFTRKRAVANGTVHGVIVGLGNGDG